MHAHMLVDLLYLALLFLGKEKTQKKFLTSAIEFFGPNLKIVIVRLIQRYISIGWSYFQRLIGYMSLMHPSKAKNLGVQLRPQK
jgi:hypothetical protein